VCLASRLRTTEAILHQPPYAFMAYTRTAAPVTTTTTSTTKIKTETTATTYPDTEKVAVACTFPFPLNSNHLHEVTVFWDVTSVRTFQVSSQASHRHAALWWTSLLSAAALLIAGYFRSVVRLPTHSLRNTFFPRRPDILSQRLLWLQTDVLWPPRTYANKLQFKIGVWL